jgi:hypothetical protein
MAKRSGDIKWSTETLKTTSQALRRISVSFLNNGHGLAMN